MQTIFSFGLAGKFAMGLVVPLGTATPTPSPFDTQDSDTVILDSPNNHVDASPEELRMLTFDTQDSNTVILDNPNKPADGQDKDPSGKRKRVPPMRSWPSYILVDPCDFL
jgi:hypothetical protein